MKKTLLFLLLIMIICPLYSQNILETTKVSETALFKRDFPRIDAENRAYFSVYAPQANKVEVTLYHVGKTYEMKKDETGYWYGVTDPIVWDSITIILLSMEQKLLIRIPKHIMHFSVVPVQSKFLGRRGELLSASECSSWPASFLLLLFKIKQ